MDIEKAKKQGMIITGTVWAVNEYQQKETKVIYHSIDLAVKGIKQMLNIKLPENFNRQLVKEDSVVSLVVSYAVKNYNGKVSPEFTAIGMAV